MKNNPWVSLLLAFLLLMVAATAYLANDLVRGLRTQEQLTYQRARLQQELAREWGIFQLLVSETVDYSKKNPALEQLLRTLSTQTNSPNPRPLSSPAK